MNITIIAYRPNQIRIPMSEIVWDSAHEINYIKNNDVAILIEEAAEIITEFYYYNQLNTKSFFQRSLYKITILVDGVIPVSSDPNSELLNRILKRADSRANLLIIEHNNNKIRETEKKRAKAESVATAKRKTEYEILKTEFADE